MDQNWLTVAGLGLDFLGFALLLREWWLAFHNEGRQLGLEENLQRQQGMRALSRTHRQPNEPNPFANLERMQDETAIRTARTVHRQAMAARRRVFLFATLLVGLGFLLQIAGAAPGCCGAIGIVPSF